MAFWSAFFRRPEDALIDEEKLLPYMNPKSGITAYATGEQAIKIRFRDGSEYLYTEYSTGRKEIETMKQLAHRGRGLNTYINQKIRHRYRRKRYRPK